MTSTQFEAVTHLKMAIKIRFAIISNIQYEITRLNKKIEIKKNL